MIYLDFPLPQLQQTVEIMPGVLWLRMPLPFELDHINLYLLESQEGWYLVDTGLNTSLTRECWLAVLDDLDKPLAGVLVTHMHPDHLGLAGWLCDRFRVPLWMTEREYFAARALLPGPNDAARWTDEAYFIQAGLPPDMVKERVAGQQGFGAVVSAVPLAYRRLVDGQVLDIGGNSWQVMVGRGHSPEHACLYCADKRVLLAGDHILPSISPNIGCYATEPEADSLRDYFESLMPFSALPDDVIVLPAHNRPFRRVADRVISLVQHHYTHLNALLDFCYQPRTLYECLPTLFNRKLTGYNLYFAVAECLAHLNFLLSERRMGRRMNNAGVYEYHSVSMQRYPAGPAELKGGMGIFPV
ncbi:MBL fold metallo-hydrolase [Alteromonas aestuariivivens]|uniref:MBL fold metallo-hydrolase n=1 Tax=Alteromonas aestuariivivens TaxID=1938339 RepID=A0A3D8ME72_9ALTE|nr:MBL fold metallo-hydrolase [Alteromonas aestuariivivens]RDV28900.1 MBL fold metallo-hydrolase [Alteromonas aestuariivivens]